ncbi:MAG: DUF480 domain-containing protein, partial [Actinomycetota bacterium]|nr:DUF480 domain-containing protein [Actinomycetota bacterium]
FVHPSHGRSVTRYRQVADEAWGLTPESSAVLAVLMLRGPQTAAELRTRTERLHRFDTVEAVEAALRDLVAAGHAQLLERLPGHKEARWQQLLAEEAEVSHAAGSSGGGSSTSERLAQLEERVARLEAALGDLLT